MYNYFYTGQDSEETSTVDPGISLLVLITGTILLLITLVAMVLRCTVKRFRGKTSSQTSHPQAAGPQGLTRVTLSSQYWGHNGTYITGDAPPTYEETVSVAQTNTNNLIETESTHPTQENDRTSDNNLDSTQTLNLTIEPQS